MNRIILFSAIVFLVSACHKNGANTNTPYKNQLISVGPDSVSYYYTYSNNKISEIYTLQTIGRYDYAHVDYSGNNYVKVTSTKSAEVYTEYFLNASKLPTEIIAHYDNNTNDNEAINFFYKQGTNLLDSINDYNVRGGQYGGNHYEFKYAGNNIIDVKLMRMPGYNYVIDYVYNYDTTKNLFRNTDSLLYIYTNPFGSTLEGGSYEDFTDQFAKIFSANTYAGCYDTSFLNQPYFYYNVSVDYILNNHGKISTERFTAPPGVEIGGMIKYSYQ